MPVSAPPTNNKRTPTVTPMAHPGNLSYCYTTLGTAIIGVLVQFGFGVSITNGVVLTGLVVLVLVFVLLLGLTEVELAGLVVGFGFGFGLLADLAAGLTAGLAAGFTVVLGLALGLAVVFFCELNVASIKVGMNVASQLAKKERAPKLVGTVV